MDFCFSYTSRSQMNLRNSSTVRLRGFRCRFEEPLTVTKLIACCGTLKIHTKEDSLMRKRYDLAVLGTGAAASTVASQCRSAGWQVAIVDSRPFGGTCALHGCDPKKLLVGAGDLM